MAQSLQAVSKLLHGSQRGFVSLTSTIVWCCLARISGRSGSNDMGVAIGRCHILVEKIDARMLKAPLQLNRAEIVLVEDKIIGDFSPADL